MYSFVPEHVLHFLVERLILRDLHPRPESSGIAPSGRASGTGSFLKCSFMKLTARSARARPSAARTATIRNDR